MRRDGDNYRLNGRDVRRQAKSALIAVRHNDSAYHAGGSTPRGLVRILVRAVLVEELYIERFGEVSAEVVRGTRLQTLAVVHHRFHRVGRLSAREFFLFGFLTDKHGHREYVPGEFFVNVQHFQGFFLRFLGGGVEGVTFLPEEFGSAEERAGGFFPAHDVSPLIDQHGKVAVGLHPLGVHLADNRFAGRADNEFFRERNVADVRDERDFGSKALDVLGFFHKITVRYQHGEVSVGVTGRLKASVHFALDIFPDSVAVRANDHRTLDRTVVDEFGFEHYVGVPLREIFFDIGNFLNKLFFLSHNKHSVICTVIL